MAVLKAASPTRAPGTTLLRMSLSNPLVRIALGLAPIIVNEIFEALVQMRDEGLSLLLVEQNVRRAAAISNACYVMEKGRIIAQGVPAQVMADETIRQRLSV